MWFTADNHFGHANQATRRGFATIEQMDEHLIDAWNSRVRPRDTVWVLGDFSFHKMERTSEIFDALNGRKHLIVGNHDTRHVTKQPWEAVHDLHKIAWQKHTFIVCHYPMLTWPNARHGVIHLHGHSHGNLKTAETTRMDVGVDTRTDMAPWSFDEIIETMATRSYISSDHH